MRLSFFRLYLLKEKDMINSAFSGLNPHRGRPFLLYPLYYFFYKKINISVYLGERLTSFKHLQLYLTEGVGLAWILLYFLGCAAPWAMTLRTIRGCPERK